MRPIEILVILANAVGFLVLTVPALTAARGTSYLAFLALPMIGVQIFVEGQRWQMIPAYILSALIFLIGIVQTIKPAGGRIEEKWIMIPVIVIGILALVFSTALPLVLPVFSLPEPSGPYAIGTLLYHWVDRSRGEIFTADPQDHRELMVQIWYPAQASPSMPHAPYIQDPRALVSLAHLLHLPDFALDHLKYTQTHAVPSAMVVKGNSSYPVLIFSAGRGGFRQESTHLFEELVSHGYIVAAVDSPYASSGVVFPDGRLVNIDPRLLPGPSRGLPTDLHFFIDVALPYLAQDVIFTLDKLSTLNRADPNGILTGRLDLQHAGLLGPSLGGLVGAEASYLDPRFRALVAMDVQMPDDVVQSGLRQPVMFISREAKWMKIEGWYQGSIDETQYTMRWVYEHLAGDAYLVLVPGMFHTNFSDAALFSPLMRWLGLVGPIDGRRANDIVSAYTLAFFDKHLKGQPAGLLDGPSEEYPEVSLQTHHSGGEPAQQLTERLPGTRWQLVSYGQPGLETRVLPGFPLTLEFDAAGNISGSGGCNTYGAQYQAVGNQISINGFVHTMRACVQEGNPQQENSFFQGLQTSSRFTVYDGRMEIWYANRQGVLNFSREIK